MKTLAVKLMRDSSQAPERATEGSVGYDIRADIPEAVTILPGKTEKIPSGFAMALEPGYAAFIYARSGLGIKHGVVPGNCVGVIDSDYRGEVIVGLANRGGEPFTVEPGDRIAQMVIAQCDLPELQVKKELDDTGRGAGGFGSTGRA